MDKEIVDQVLKNLTSYESLRLYYKGINEKGKTGIISIYLRDFSVNPDDCWVNSINGLFNKFRMQLIDLQLEDDYLFAKYNVYKKSLIFPTYHFNFNCTVVLPYSSIISMSITPTKK